jgi:putative aminopeptidase FrvX
MLSLHVLKELSELDGPSGFEDEVAQYILALVRQWGLKPQWDQVGNIYVSCPGKGHERGEKDEKGEKITAFIAHMDEISLSIERKRGSMLVCREKSIPGRKVNIRPLRGLGRQSPNPSQNSIPGILVSEHLILPLEPIKGPIHKQVTYRYPFKQKGDLLIGKALDDRVGCYLLLSLLRWVVMNPKHSPLLAIFSTQEENLGGPIYLDKWQIGDLYIVEVIPTLSKSLSRTTLLPKEIGEGVTITLEDAGGKKDRSLIRHVYRIAKRSGINLWPKIEPYSGTDEIRLNRAHYQRAAILGVAIHNMHLPPSICSLRDVKDLFNLMIELARP